MKNLPLNNIFIFFKIMPFLAFDEHFDAIINFIFVASSFFQIIHHINFHTCLVFTILSMLLNYFFNVFIINLKF